MPFVYRRPLNLEEGDLLFSSILENHSPKHWPDETEERECVL